MANCCINCFEDSYLIDFIIENGNESDCDYCGSQNVKCIGTEELTDEFQEFLNIYEETTYGEHFGPYDDPIDAGERLIDLIQIDWIVFSDSLEKDAQEDLLFEILDISYDECGSISKDTYFSPCKNSFTYVSSDEAWQEFCDELKHSNRFFPECNWRNQLESIAEDLKETLSENTVFYRARLGYKKDNGAKIAYPSSEMGVPPLDKSKNGRGNPAGISYLYVATNIKTALSEVRPWVLAEVSVAKLKTNVSLNIVDLSIIKWLKTPFGHRSLKDAIENLNLMRRLSSDLSTPVNPDSVDYEYVPTQYLTELIKYLGYDGIKFKSSLGDEDNLIIFDSSKVTIDESTQLFTVTRVDYSF